MKRFVYLAGPVSHGSGQQALAWRDEVREELEEYRDWECIDTVDSVRLWIEDKDHLYPTGYDSAEVSDRVLYNHCKFSMTKADAVLVNLTEDVEQVSIGTVMEIVWAVEAGKFVIVCMDGGLHNHAFIKSAASIVVPTLERGIAYLTETL